METIISTNSKLAKAKKSLPKPENVLPTKLTKELPKTVKKKHKASKKHVKKHFHTIAPIGVMLVVVGVLLAPRFFTTDEVVGESFSVRVFNPDSSISVDEVTSANVAKIIANDADMIVAGNVNNLASNVEAKVELAISEQSYVAKPQIVETQSRSIEDIIEYTVKEGETVSSIAEKFGITSDTVRWANDLTGSLVAEGKKLTILPVSGLLYEVEEGDTAAKLADKYDSDAEQIISFNDAEISGLKTGTEIIIPGGQKPAPPPVVTFASIGSAYTGPGTTSTPVWGGNSYVWGNCTWYVSNRRAELGRPVPNNLGNAGAWAYTASSYGMKVNYTPAAGAVLVEPVYPLGHVAVVERVNPDGSVLISEMNYGWALGVYHERTIPADRANSYRYIH